MISQSKQNKSATDCFRGQQPKYRTVIFISAIPGSDLAARIRRIEMYNTKGRKFRVRIVEKSGQAVRDLIGTGYPWSYEKCDKDYCFLCSTSVKTNVSCQKQRMDYRISCTQCENNGFVCEYEGETGRSLYARGS